jgi:hypothetical protein
MSNKSTIVTPLKKRDKKGIAAIEKFKQNLKSKLMNAGMVSVYVPGTKALSLEESKISTKENDIKALLHMFSLVRQENVSFIQSEMPDPEPEVKALAEKVYTYFSKYHGEKLPLKRVVVSLIVASCLTVDMKLSYLYRLYTSLTGTGNLEEEQNCFLLDDIIELIQLLCELHLVYIPPEDVPHLTEQIMTKGGINRITNSYLVSANVSTPESITKVLMSKNLKKEGNTADVIDVTIQVQATFAEHWETWEHKQVFTEDPSSFCFNLKEILKGSSARPKNSGPYRLIICYRHNGENFYKVLDYDERERLKVPKEATNEMTDLMIYCKNNFSFVGQRIKMSRDEFLYRMKKFPMLTELMRLHLASSAAVPVAKESTSCKVYIMKGNERVAVVNFNKEDRNDDFGEEEQKYNFDVTPCIINTKVTYKDCLALEIKDRIIASIEEAIEDVSENYRSIKIPDGLDHKNLNHSLKLFCDGKLIDDFDNFKLDVRTLVNTHSHEID